MITLRWRLWTRIASGIPAKKSPGTMLTAISLTVELTRRDAAMLTIRRRNSMLSWLNSCGSVAAWSWRWTAVSAAICSADPRSAARRAP